MEILTSYGPHSSLFVVIKPFSAHPLGELKSRVLSEGEEVRFDEKTNAVDIVGWCRLGRIAIANMPAIARYRARRPFSLRVSGKMEHVAHAEVCEIAAGDAWTLLLSGAIAPLDEFQWTPNRLLPKREGKPRGIR